MPFMILAPHSWSKVLSRTRFISRDRKVYVRAAASMASTKPTVKVEIISDTVCPWCYMGKLRLEKAMKQFKDQLEFEVKWLPFQLDANASLAGVDKLELYNSKFGAARVAQMIPHMTGLFAEEGIKYSIGGLTGNTFDSHRLIEWAGHKGPEVQNALVAELFTAYFSDEKFINDREVLVAAADKVGLAGAREHLAEPGNGYEETKAALQKGRCMGVSGVPFFIVDGKHTLSGAQPPEEFARIFSKLAQQQ